VLKIQLQNGEEKCVVILTEKEADNCWLLEQDGKKAVDLSKDSSTGICLFWKNR